MADGSQSTRIERTPEGQVRIQYDRTSTGEVVTRELILEAANCDWLAEKLTLAADDNLPDTDGDFPPDKFRLYIGGGHGYDDINVNVSNERAPDGLYGKFYLLSGMEVDIARNLASQLGQI